MDNIPDLRFRWEENLFSFFENVPKLSYSNAEFKMFLGDNTPDPRFRGEESLFLFSKMYRNSPIAMQNSNIFPGTIHRTPVLGGRKVGFISPKMYQNAPTAMQNSKKIQNSRTPVFGKGRGSCLLLKLCLATPLLSNISKTIWDREKVSIEVN